MKYKKVNQILSYVRKNEADRRKAVNFLIKKSIQKAEEKSFEKLVADLRMPNKNLYKVCNLF